MAEVPPLIGVLLKAGQLHHVPKQAISMSMHHILKSKALVSTVPDARKADAVANSLKGEITVDVPGSFLLSHPNSTIFLDKNSAAKLP